MTFDPSTIRVALLAGGTSGERQISLASGAGAKAALERAGFPVETFDPAERGDLIRLLEGEFDVAFLCLHGRGGEDGAMQGFLEVAGIPYIGPGVWSSATAMEKHLSKVFYVADGIPTPESVTLFAGAPYDLDAIIGQLGEHVAIKPSGEGSALGVTIAQDLATIERGLAEAFKLGDEVLIERFVKGTELTVAVIGNDDPVALPIIEIVPQNSFYDFESKYAPGGSKHICPAPLPEDLTARVQDLAVRAHRALGCRGVSRSDLILDEQGQPWVLETNTIPGMTETSLLPDAGRAAGMEFPELCAKLIEFALEGR